MKIKSSIKNKILILLGTMFFLFVINNLWAIVNLRKLDNSINAIMKSNYNSIVAVQDMSLILERQDSLQLSYIFTKNKDYIKKFYENKEYFYENLKIEENNITEKGERELARKISENYKIYNEKFEKFLNVKDEDKMQNFYFSEIFCIFEELKKNFRDLIELNQSSMLNKKEMAAEISKQAVISIIILVSATTVIWLMLSSYIVNGIFAQFRELIEKMEKISKGDYSQRINPLNNRELKKLAETFNKMSEELNSYKIINIKKLKKADEMKSEFVATVSHEFKTPLTSIGMAVSMLGESGNLNKDQKECINIIKEENERLNVLVKDLLDLSRIESGKTVMNIKENYVSEIIKNAVNPLKKLFESENVCCEIKEIDLNYKVNADYNRITWVMTNLLTNAVKYKNDLRKLKIEINAVKQDEKIIFSVKDNGIGIEKEFHEKIFNKFIRVSVDERGKVTGTGLGLSICKGIIDAHEGKIWVESEKGIGSTFYFELKAV